jgi:MFS family permease
MMTWISCAVTALAGYSAGEISPSSSELTKEWGISQVVYNLGITLFCVGFALAPMVLAPFSEINGRRPIFIASGIVFVGMVFLGNDWQRVPMLIIRVQSMHHCLWRHSLLWRNACCAIFPGRRWMYVNRTTATLLLSQLLTAAATFSTMVGGVISDIYHAEDRNTPMALFSGAALFGTGLAPMLAGAVVQHTTWRWVWYSHAIVSAVFVVIIFLFFKETRGSVLLSRKAKALNTYYDQLESAGHYGVIMSDKEKVRRIRWKVKSDEERASLAQMISISCYRPFRELPSIYYPSNAILTREQDLLVTEPTVFFFSLWVSFSWAVLYLQFGSVPLVFKTNHGFNVEQSGAVFACMSPTIPGIGLADNFQPCVLVSSS